MSHLSLRSRRPLMALLALVTALVCVAATAGAVCVDHFEQTTLPNTQIGLWDFYPDLQTAGDHLYLFDNGHLDCLNIADPTAWFGTGYTPSIDFASNPTDLLKVGDNHLYATATGALSVIDISVQASPTLVGTIGTIFTGAGPVRHLGDNGDFLYFLDDEELVIVDATNPAVPTLASTTAFTFTGGYYQLTPVLYQDRVYVFAPDYPSSFAIVNVSDPSAPVVTYPDLDQPPYYPDFYSWVEFREIRDHFMHLQFHDLPGDWDRYYDLTDPDNPVETWDWPAAEYPGPVAFDGDLAFYGTSGTSANPGIIHPATAVPMFYDWTY